jgi:hypothetical protein
MEQGPSWNANMRPEILEILHFYGPECWLFCSQGPTPGCYPGPDECLVDSHTKHVPWTYLAHNSSVYLTIVTECMEVMGITLVKRGSYSRLVAVAINFTGTNS